MSPLIPLINEEALKMNNSQGMIKVELEALDEKPITPKTGKTKVTAVIDHFPIQGQKQLFLYTDESCESYGVRIETNNIERIGQEIKFFDYRNRPFKIKIIK